MASYEAFSRWWDRYWLALDKPRAVRWLWRWYRRFLWRLANQERGR